MHCAPTYYLRACFLSAWETEKGDRLLLIIKVAYPLLLIVLFNFTQLYLHPGEFFFAPQRNAGNNIPDFVDLGWL